MEKAARISQILDEQDNVGEESDDGSATGHSGKASKVLRQEQTLTLMVEEDDDMVFGEDYDNLGKSLEQARKLALKKKEEAAPSGLQAVALLESAKKDQEDTQSSTIGKPQENKVVIAEMEEFVLGLQLNKGHLKILKIRKVATFFPLLKSKQ